MQSLLGCEMCCNIMLRRVQKIKKERKKNQHAFLAIFILFFILFFLLLSFPLLLLLHPSNSSNSSSLNLHFLQKPLKMKVSYNSHVFPMGLLCKVHLLWKYSENIDRNSILSFKCPKSILIYVSRSHYFFFQSLIT